MLFLVQLMFCVLIFGLVVYLGRKSVYVSILLLADLERMFLFQFGLHLYNYFSDIVVLYLALSAVSFRFASTFFCILKSREVISIFVIISIYSGLSYGLTPTMFFPNSGFPHIKFGFLV